jgi:hypothetical protein
MRVAQRWEFVGVGSLCLESVRALHQPPERFRVSPSCYSAGTAFGGAARAGRKYVLAGACSYTIGGEVWELRAGDIADLPEGGFAFRTLGGGLVEVVSVWELPAAFWFGVPDTGPGTPPSNS